MAPEYKKYEVVDVARETPSIFTIVCSPKEGAVPPYKPGQFFMIKNVNLPEEVKPKIKPYSVLCPHDEKKICFGVKVHGAFSTALSKLEKGQELELSGPYGFFTLPDQAGEPLVFLAGGIGITPFVCMGKHLAGQRHAGKYCLIYSNRHFEETAYKKEFDEIARENENFKLVCTLTGENAPSDWKGERGRVSIEMIKKHVGEDFLRAHYYMCGTGNFLEDMKKALLENGVAKEKVHVEKW